MSHPLVRSALALLAGAALLLVPAGPASSADGASEPALDAATATDHPEPEALRLACRGIHRRDRVAVVCKWSAAGSADVVGYRLRRGGDGHRVTVARTERTGAVDRTITPGVRYLYRVEAVNAAGRIIGLSRVVTAGVPAPAG